MLLALLSAQPAGADESASVVGLIHDARDAVGATNLTQALEFSTQAVRTDPAYGEAWKQHGRVLMLMHRSQEAQRSFDLARQLMPNDPDLPDWQQHLMVDLGLYRELAQQINAMPDEEAARVDDKLLSRILGEILNDDDPAEAGQLASHWAHVATNKTSRSALEALTCLTRQDLENAVHNLEQARPSETVPNTLAALAYDQLGLALMTRQEYRRAIAAFEASLTHQPDGRAALRDLGWAQRKNGQPEQAIATWQRGLALNPPAVEWLAWMATTQLELGRVADAEHSADALLAVHPEHEKARRLKLATLFIQNKPEAAAFEDEVRAGVNGQRTAALGHALAECQSKNFTAAVQRLESCYQAAPADQEVKQALLDAYSQWAASSNHKEAVAPLERILALEPNQPGALRDLGWVYWARGDREKGVALLDQAIEKGVANRDEVIAQVYTDLTEAGQRDQAIELLKKWAPGTSMQTLGRRLFDQGRLVAAEPALELAWLAWANTSAPADIGLRLAFTRALNGRCEEWTTYFNPQAESVLTQLDAAGQDMLFETLSICGDQKEAFTGMNFVEKKLGGRPAFDAHVTEIMAIAADRCRIRQDYSQALRLYRRVLARDQERFCYLRAAECADSLGRRDVAIGILSGAAKKATNEAIRLAATGKIYEYRGNLSGAVDDYLRSLTVQPEQPDVRQALFNLLVRQGRLAEAREQANWFVRKYETDKRYVSTDLAEMWTALGDTEDALKFWQALREANPASAYATIELARILYHLGRPAEAETLLVELNQHHEEVRAYELLAEIHAAQARSDQVIIDTDKGLTLDVTKELLRLRAEAAEILGRPETAYAASHALLQEDPGNAAMARLTTRALMDLGRWEEARTLLEDLIRRNPANLNALVSLRRIAAQERRLDEAVNLSKTVVQQRPWDLEAIRRCSVSLADDQHFHAALTLLGTHVERDPAPGLAALVYRDVISGPYPGRNTPEQIAAHVARLAEAGYQFLTPDQLHLPALPRDKSVLIIIADADARSMAAIDQALAAHGARATYAGCTTSDDRERPGQPTKAQLKALRDHGRWFLASSGPLERNRIVVDARGTLGNPLTQRELASATGAPENNDQMSRRLGELLENMAVPLTTPERVLIYPNGDYGQLSLDADAQAPAELRRALASSFTMAFAADETGFIPPNADPLRLPSKTIPPAWNGDRLLQHLLTADPAVNLQLQQAKVLYWNRQHDEANPWFARALAHGAQAQEVKYNWGANAFHQGDFPTSERLLSEALLLDPNDQRVATALQRTRSAVDPRLNLFVSSDEDNFDRKNWQYGAWLRGPLTQSLRPEVLLDVNQWQRKGWKTADGLRYGAGARWYVQPQYWVDGRLWRMDYEDQALNDFWGGFLRVRVPTPRLGGDINLEASHDEVDTVEAIQRAIEQWNYSIRTSSRIWDRIDAQFNGSYIDRDDVNDTQLIEGRLLWRAREAPYVGFGLYGHVADSDFNPTAYYAPMELHQYQLMGQWRGTAHKLNYNLTAQGGYARAQYRDWRFAWGTRVLLEYPVWRQLYLFSDMNYQDTVGYQRGQMTGGISTRF